MKVKIKKLVPEAVIPFKTHDRDTCFDCVAISKKYKSDTVIEYGLGFSLELDPYDLEYEILNNVKIFSFDFRPRSSIYKTGLVLCNSVGTGDEDYRGEYKAFFYHVDKSLPAYEIGDKVVQLKIGMTPMTTFELVEELSSTVRGTGGFGSTGK